MRKHALIFCLLLLGQLSFAQEIIDSCFTSVDPGTDFDSSADLANNSPVEADILEWTGTDWIGGWSGANLTIAPPGEGTDCRAIFIGSGTAWTTGGEGFGLRLSESLIPGQTYSFDITYVSHGTGSDGDFSPMFYTNSFSSITGGTLIGNLTSVGYSWETHTFSFTATPGQDGHQWILIHSGPNGSSGLINSFCSECQDCNSFPQSFNFGPDISLCQGETLTLDATTANSTYLWQDGSSGSQFTVDQEGSYWVEITNECGILSDTIQVSFGSAPDPVDLGEDLELCKGDTLLLDVSANDAEYLWQDNSTNPIFEVTQTGTYSVEVSNTCGSVSDEITVNFTPLPNINFGTDLSLCEGETLTLDATTENGIYLWQDASSGAQFIVTEPGSFWVQVSNDCGSDSDTISVAFLTPPLPVDLGADADLCLGESLMLDLSSFSNLQFLWQDDTTEPVYNITESGLYWVEASNVCGAVYDSISVTFTTFPDIDLGSNINLCPGETALLEVTGIQGDFNWHNGSGGTTFLITQPGVYWVEVTNACGIDSDTMEAFYFEPPQIDLGNDTLVCYGETVLLDATLPTVDYLWQDNSTGPTYLVTDIGNYAVTVSNPCGQDSSSINIAFEECALCDIYIPNVFSPNDDGRNDLFTPLSNCGFENYTFSIFSRWGEQIFVTNDPNEAWNGKFRGEKLPAGVYVYQVSFRFSRLPQKVKSGSFTLVR